MYNLAIVIRVDLRIMQRGHMCNGVMQRGQVLRFAFSLM